jgi:hypothetical protein
MTNQPDQPGQAAQVAVSVTGIDLYLILPDEISESPDFSEASLRKEIASALHGALYGGALPYVIVSFNGGEVDYVNGRVVA